MSSVYYKKLLNYNLAYYDDNTPMVNGNTQFYTVTGLHWGNSPLYSNVYNTTYEKVWEISDRLSFAITVSYRSGYYHCVGSITFDEHTTNIEFDNGLNTKQRDFGIIIDDDISEAWCYFVGDNSRSNQTTTSVQAFTCMPYDKQAFYSYIKSLMTIISNGGGATHIAKRTGQLKNLSSNLSDILMVSGGGGGGAIVPTGSNVFQGYTLFNDTELHWETYGDIIISLPNNSNSNRYRAYIVVIHRQTISLPVDWHLLDIRDNRCSWHQYISIYDKVISQNETVRVTQSSSDALAIMTFYTEAYNTIKYDNEYYPFSYDSDSLTWNIEQENYKRFFVFSEGYYSNGEKSIEYFPSLDGWQIPPIISSNTGVRAYCFFMNSQESYSSSTLLTYNGLRTGSYTQDLLDSSQICSYKIIETAIREGADAGGIAGNNNRSANQTHGYAFGEGESATDDSAGGGGFYGGYKDIIGGGAGSGYIGNSQLINKKMVGYNVPTSSAEETKTESINEVSVIPVSGKPKSGNGFARITFLEKSIYPPEYEQYIRRMNEADDGCGFWWKNETGELPVWTNRDAETLKEGAAGKPIDGMVWSNHSYYSCYFGNYHEWGEVNGQYNVPYWTDNTVFTSTNVLTLNIISNNDNTYTGTISGANDFVNLVWQYKSSASSSWSNRRYVHILRKNNITAYVADGVNNNSNPPDMTRTGTLEYVLGQFSAYFRNIKVYVDGICWADPTQ